MNTLTSATTITCFFIPFLLACIYRVDRLAWLFLTVFNQYCEPRRIVAKARVSTPKHKSTAQTKEYTTVRIT